MCWCGPFWVSDSLWIFSQEVYFLSQVREVFGYYIFKYVVFHFLSSPSGTPIR